jgi:hypothetical protein
MSKVIGSLERGWLPDYLDLGDCTVEQNGVSPELELSGVIFSKSHAFKKHDPL